MFDFPYPYREEPCIFHKSLHYFSLRCGSDLVLDEAQKEDQCRETPICLDAFLNCTILTAFDEKSWAINLMRTGFHARCLVFPASIWVRNMAHPATFGPAALGHRPA